MREEKERGKERRKERERGEERRKERERKRRKERRNFTSVTSYVFII